MCATSGMRNWHSVELLMPVNMDVEYPALQRKLAQIQTALEMAVQADLEHGVQWLNDAAAKEFAERYPNIWQVIGNIGDM